MHSLSTFSVVQSLLKLPLLWEEVVIGLPVEEPDQLQVVSLVVLVVLRALLLVSQVQ